MTVGLRTRARKALRGYLIQLTQLEYVCALKVEATILCWEEQIALEQQIPPSANIWSHPQVLTGSPSSQLLFSEGDLVEVKDCCTTPMIVDRETSSLMQLLEGGHLFFLWTHKWIGEAGRFTDPLTLGGYVGLYNPVFFKPLLGEKQYLILPDFNKSPLLVVFALFDAYFSMRSLVAKMEEWKWYISVLPTELTEHIASSALVYQSCRHGTILVIIVRLMWSRLGLSQ